MCRNKDSFFNLISAHSFFMFVCFYSLMTFLYSAIAIFAARYALIRLVCACVHDSCAESTSTMLALPSLYEKVTKSRFSSASAVFSRAVRTCCSVSASLVVAADSSSRILSAI